MDSSFKDRSTAFKEVVNQIKNNNILSCQELNEPYNPENTGKMF